MTTKPNLRGEISKVISGGANEGAYQGAVGVVAQDSHSLYLRAFGSASVLPVREKMNDTMLFDLASVTKVVATTTSVMTLVDDGRMSLSDRVASIEPEFGANGKEHVTVLDLLTHTSGLSDWADLYTRHSTSQDVLRELCSLGLSYPSRKSVLYSDLGFMMLGRLVERVSGDALDRYSRRRVFDPLGMKSTMFNPPKRLAKRCVPTEYSNWRLRMVRGEVHDENALAMKGVSGHAGLFSTAQDLAKFAMMVYNKGEVGGTRILSPESVDLMATNHTQGLNESRGLGWIVNPEFAGSAVTWEIGHNGYTGVSMAISLKKRAFAALLTNRVHPVREGNIPGDKSVGIMMARRRRWIEYLPKFYQLAEMLVGGEN
jgi:CubicO group peptidase (beta-lactamase class C family)